MPGCPIQYFKYMPVNLPPRMPHSAHMRRGHGQQSFLGVYHGVPVEAEKKIILAHDREYAIFIAPVIDGCEIKGRIQLFAWQRQGTADELRSVSQNLGQVWGSEHGNRRPRSLEERFIKEAGDTAPA